MNTLTIEALEQPCTRCRHARAVHTGGAKAWGWAIYEDTWANGNGCCSETYCSCEKYTDDPAAAPAPPRTFTPPKPLPPQPCGHFNVGDRLRCGATPARLFPNGWKCGSHTPSALAGQQEPGEGGCAPLRHLCTTEARCATWVWQQQPWRVLATGGRDRDDKARIWSEFDKILLVHPRLTVVHGAAYPRRENGVRPDRSADWLIHLWCQRNPDVVEEAHPANWKTHGRGAGLIRNTEMAKLGADECVAFPGEGNGTRHCMAQASAAGILVRPIWPHAPAVAHA